MTADLVPVPVPGADTPLQAVQIDGRAFVALRPLCDSLGIDYSNQLKKLRSRSWATVVLNATVAADGLTREMALIDRSTMTMWLATLDERRVSPQIRPQVMAYQREATAALDAYFNVSARPTTIDGIRAMLDQIEAAQRDASQAREIAARTDARLDAIEGKHDWFSALGFARHTGIKNTSTPAMQRLGIQAKAIAKANGIAPEKVPHHLYGTANLLPLWIWELAAEGRRELDA